jgi:hypothetical protein
MSKPLTHHVIALARSYIADQRHWTQCAQALLKNGRPTHPHSDRAWRFCATGALVRAGFTLTGDYERAQELCTLACEALRPNQADAQHDIESTNDARDGHAVILRMFDHYLDPHQAGLVVARRSRVRDKAVAV